MYKRKKKAPKKPDGKHRKKGAAPAKKAESTDIMALAKRFGLTAKFSAACEQEAALLKDKKLMAKGRLDFRKKTVITIDGADAKDLDDAISLERTKCGYVLGVHIADVSHYVWEGGALDNEALRRGTSVYLIDKVIPMLPKTLSNGLCSLHPGADRYTLSCIMEIDGNGEVTSHDIQKSIIRSKHRMTYGDVNRILEGDEALTDSYAGIAGLLKDMNELAGKLRAKRFERGSIDFDIAEPKIELNAKGVAIGVDVRERGDAEKLIEEFMLRCNVTVAQHFFALQKPFIYRVHEQPDADRMRELAAFLSNYGIRLRGAAGIKPKTIQRILTKVEGTDGAAAINRVTLRSLQKARYDVSPIEHFGLAEEQYCHFTSPIRRYPDLMVHRIVKLYLAGKLNGRKETKLEAMLPAVAGKSSDRERNAVEAERTVGDIKMAEYMSGRIGEEYQGVISGVTRFGIFVELGNTIEGMIPLSTLEDDYYEWHEKQYCLIGEKTKKKYSLGDRIKISVAATDISAGKIEFALAK